MRQGQESQEETVKILLGSHLSGKAKDRYIGRFGRWKKNAVGLR